MTPTEALARASAIIGAGLTLCASEAQWLYSGSGTARRECVLSVLPGIDGSKCQRFVSGSFDDALELLAIAHIDELRRAAKTEVKP